MQAQAFAWLGVCTSTSSEGAAKASCNLMQSSCDDNASCRSESINQVGRHGIMHDWWYGLFDKCCPPRALIPVLL